MDIGLTNNSTDDIGDQMVNGLRQKDLDALSADGRIPTSTEINCAEALYVNGDPGLSVGFKAAVREIHGLKRIVPIYDTLDTSSGLEFHVVRWGVVTVIDSSWTGEKKTEVWVEKSHTYSGELTLQPDLSNRTKIIEGAFTSPVLVR